MSGPRVIAAVTAALQDRLGAVASATVPNAVVSTARPDTRRNPEQTPMVNAFLYEVATNPFLRNLDEPTRDSGGHFLNEPLAALDLHYLITFNGADATLDAQRLLGAIVMDLVAEPSISHDAVAAAADSRTELAGVRLDRRSGGVVLSPLDLSLEELSRLWSVLMHEPYALSIQYGATVLLFSADVARTRSLDVSTVNVVVDSVGGADS